ncbi:hypothetical protein [Enterococcus sp. LJL51]|uniref:hypothetical protein n=1 Tax=Enterococcus sp. LJL51 TaxID=3416656 RepID=UPI003CF3DAC3
MEKVTGIVGLGLLFGLPTTARAENRDYVRFNDRSITYDLSSTFDSYAYDQRYVELDELAEKLELGLISENDYDVAYEAIYQKWEEKMDFTQQFGLFTPEFLTSMERFSGGFDDNYTSFNGLEVAVNLKSFVGEEGNTKDIRPLRKLTKLEELNIEITNQLNLYDLKNAQNLKDLRLYTRGYGNEEEEAEEQLHTQALLTDISALSELNQLEHIMISSEGIMPTITLKRGTTFYELYDPIVPSDQFQDAEMSYSSQDEGGTSLMESNERLKWHNLTGQEEFLSFS